MSEPLVICERDEGLATLTLNRPDRMNALSVSLFGELGEHLTAIAVASDEVGCVLLVGAGRCFSAGNDLHDIAAGATTPHAGYQAGIIDRLAALPQPVIVGVHGYCLTGALELALAGDLIVAAENARFGDTHGTFGMSPVWGMSQRLPRRVGRAAALEMMLTARHYGAAEAHAIGLADRVVPDLLPACAELVKSILDNSWFSAREAKRLLAETEDLPLAEGLALERGRAQVVAPDFAERMSRWR